MSLHERLGEVFRAFEHGSRLRRTDDWDVASERVVGEVVVDALHEWVFWSDDDHVDMVCIDEFLQFLEVVDPDVYVFAAVACSGISWCDIQFLYLFALSYFPGECMFATAAS